MQLRVMTWNLHGSARPDLAEVARRITAFAPDVVGLQELQSWQARRIARRVGMEHRWARKHFPYSPLLWWRAEGMAIMSRHDLSDHERFVLNPSVSAMTYRRRVAQRTTVTLQDGSRLAAYNAHLASHNAPGERVRQAVVIAGRIAQETIPCILTGDLNAAGEPEALAPFRSVRLGDAWPVDVGDGFTSDTRRPHQRIDYVLTPAGWRTVSAEVPPTDDSWVALSDHLPAVLTLESA